MEKKKRKRDSFTSGVLILSLSAIIVKIIGLIYKIPMLRLLGSEGMGYFNSAYELFALFSSIATTGLPVAMAVMIASRRKGGAVFRAAITLVLIVGIAGCALLIAFAKPFAEFLGSEMAALSIVAISPAVLLSCLSGAYRGYFQGNGKMAPTALSQLIEALGKLIPGLILASVALSLGFSVEVVAAFAVLGLVLGMAASLLFLSVLKGLFGKHDGIDEDIRERGITASLLRTAIPVTLSSIAVSAMRVADMSLIIRRLQTVGFSDEEAFAAYGNYTTLALPLFSLAPALVTSVAMPLIPALSAAVTVGDRAEQRRVIGDALRISALVAMPISFGLTLFSEPILKLIFSGEDMAVSAAAPLLCILGISVPLSCMITVGNAVLQAYGRPATPIFSMLAGSFAKLCVAYFLISEPSVGLLGAPIGTLVCDMIINGVNFFFISRVLPDGDRDGEKGRGLIVGMLMPAISAAASVSLSRVAYSFAVSRLGESASVTLASILLAALLYFAAVMLTGSVKREEITKIPLVRRLCIEKKEKEI